MQDQQGSTIPFIPRIKQGDTISVVHKGFVAICRVEHVRLKTQDDQGPVILSGDDMEPSTIGQEADIVAVIERAVCRT